MEIAIWSDYVCPFCYIGKRRLERALEETGFSSQVTVHLKSYQLDAGTPEVVTESIYESLARKYNTTIEQAKAMTANVIEQAKSEGLEYNFDNAKPANTARAHRLVKWADTQGKGNDLGEALLQAYFIDGKNINDSAILIELATSVGLDASGTEEVLMSNQFFPEIQIDQTEAAQIGVQGVPFFVLNNKYAISGAQPIEVFKEALQKVAEEEGLKPTLQTIGGQGATCDGDVCDF
ncbi:DsbA family oxidoreductase [Chryseomicrobium sp. FSL W7-1435]|uniref:DsbA family oxidoreductase n=1 Tax=Chryseomicrobium sp. FSL W7-1435 TaxID=2921704 RepID=UPI00315B254E